MAKMGQAESTVDPEFNQLETSLKEQHSKMKKLTKFVQNYQQAITGEHLTTWISANKSWLTLIYHIKLFMNVIDLGVAQSGMSQMISNQYEQHDRMFPIADQLANQITPQIDIYRDSTVCILFTLAAVSIFVSKKIWTCCKYWVVDRCGFGHGFGLGINY
jgi:hypothetical protein